jgi:hypothetical protein
VNRRIIVHSSLEGVSEILEGSDVTLSGELVGYDNTDYTVQWYYRLNGQGDYIPIEGATDLVYVYQITQENKANTYHLGVTVTEFADGQ